MHEEQTPRLIRALVIGAGPTTTFAHLPHLAELRDRGEVALISVCDIERQRAAAARRDFGFLEDGGEASAALRRPDIDAVYIFGSAQMHYEYGLAALRSGKHLFVEKPVAPTYEQARDLARAARDGGLIAAGGLNRRFLKSLRAVRDRAGKTRWRFAEAVFHKSEFRNPPSFGAASWLGANGIHALDALVFMMGGLPLELSALADDSAGARPSTFSAIMRWHDGAQAVFLCDNNAGARREEYVFHGLGETCRVDGTGLTVERDGTSQTIPYPAIGDGFAAEHAAFLEAIRSGTEPLHSISAIAPSIHLAELIEAGFSGRVRLPEETPMVRATPRSIPGSAILVVPSTELQPGLGRLLAQHPLVSMEDVQQSPDIRSDIAAAILGRGSPPLPVAVLDKLPRLQVVGIMALSLARHEPEMLLARGISIVNASAAYADSVAQFALALAILGRRRAFGSHEIMRRGGWGTDPGMPGLHGMLRRIARSVRPAAKAMGLEAPLLSLWRQRIASQGGALRSRAATARDLTGATVGLIGWSENGRVFAAYLKRVGAHIIVFSEHANPDEIRAAGAAPASLGEVLAADIVSLHRGLTPDTLHFLGAAELAKLRPGAVLINIARGALIEPNALLARLERCDIIACLDTYDSEPLAASHPLRRLPNVFLTSHIAGGSMDMHAAAADEVIRKVIAHLNGDAVKSISAERLRSMT
jgi:phosphoglycerate dehydrogenase-like enzyme/predicted dehydrogenase